MIESHRLSRLLDAAVRAPSSHNTQPWLFRQTDTGLELHADRSRALPENDPDDRELAISCGCALLNLCVAAAYADIRARISICPEPDDAELLARIELADLGSTSRQDAALYPAVTKRRTCRARFIEEGVPNKLLQACETAAEREGCWLVTVDEPRRRQSVADLVAAGDAAQWASRPWRRELAFWMRPPGSGDGLDVSRLTLPIARRLVAAIDMGSMMSKRDRKLAMTAPALLLLGSTEDQRRDWVSTGQALERVLLTAAGSGIQASFLNQPIQVTALRDELGKTFELPGFPQILIRLGIPKVLPKAAARRGVEAVVRR